MGTVYVLIDSWISKQIDSIDPENVSGSAGVLSWADSIVFVRVGCPITRVAGVRGEAFMRDLASDLRQVAEYYREVQRHWVWPCAAAIKACVFG